MTNDSTTITGSLQELIDTMENNLQEKGVDAIFDSSTGLIGLADKILDIEGGGGNCIVEYSNLGTEFNYTRHSGGIILNLPSKITSLGTHCFDYCYGLKEITIPSTVTTLGSYCFSNCVNLEIVSLSNNITSIPSYCFYACESLESLTLPTGITSIGQSAFYNCKMLEEISIPSTVTTINPYAFQNCSALESATLPSNISSIPTYCFDGCRSLTDIEIPSNVTTFSNYCFRNCSNLKIINLPSNTKTLNNYSFQNCTSLLTINIPSTVTTIGTQCFNGCSSLLGYKLNWTEANKIITYNASNMPLPTNARIVIPNGTTSLYTSKNYPVDSLIEEQDITVEIKDYSENHISHDSSIQISVRVVEGVTPVSNATVTITDNDNYSSTNTTDNTGQAIFNIDDITSDTTYTISCQGATKQISIDYRPYIFYDECNSADGLSLYNLTPINLYGSTSGSPSLTYNATENAYQLYGTNSGGYMLYPILSVNNRKNITLSYETKISSTNSNLYVGMGISPPETDLSIIYANVIYTAYYSSTQTSLSHYTIKKSSQSSQGGFGNWSHSPDQWLRTTVVIDDEYNISITWEKLDKSNSYSPTTKVLANVDNDVIYGIYVKGTSSSYKGYIRNIRMWEN